MSLTIIPILAFKDNYIWLVSNSHTKQCFVVDPGDAELVLKKITEFGFILTDILITHHHWDHTNGVKELAKQCNAKVYGSINSPFANCDVTLKEGSKITLLSDTVQFNILEIPGHTLDHIAYYNDEMLFCGDTLFSAGCGRLFEGTPQQMFCSLQKLAGLNKHINVYCGHEYTLANLKFALHVEPHNVEIIKYQSVVLDLRKRQQPSLPSTLEQELKINPFLRTHKTQLIQRIKERTGNEHLETWQIFYELRKWKDNFA